MDTFPQLGATRRTAPDSRERIKPTSQAEYAGSIPVIGSTKALVGALLVNRNRPGRGQF